MALIYNRHRVRKAQVGLATEDKTKYDFKAIQKSYDSLNEELRHTKDPKKKEAISSKMVALSQAVKSIKHYYKYGEDYGSYYNSPGVQEGLYDTDGAQDWLDNWIKDPEFKRRLENNIGPSPIDSFTKLFGTGTNYTGEKADKIIQGSLDNLNRTKIYINTTNPNHSKDTATELFNTSSASDRSHHNYLSNSKTLKGQFIGDKDAVVVTNNTAKSQIGSVLSHELTHASGLDDFYIPYLPEDSKLRSDVNTKLKKKYGPGAGYIGKGWGRNYAYTTGNSSIQSDIDSVNVNVGSINAQLLDYVDKSEEVYPRLMNIRYVGGFEPGEIVTQEMLDKVKGSYHEDLFRVYSDEQILHMLNTFAANDNSAPRDITTQGTRVARTGLKFRRKGLLY